MHCKFTLDSTNAKNKRTPSALTNRLKFSQPYNEQFISRYQFKYLARFCLRSGGYFPKYQKYGDSSSSNETVSSFLTVSAKACRIAVSDLENKTKHMSHLT